MAGRQELTPLSDTDYDAIEAAVMETGRGRWFLAEFARRNRTADTGMLLEAIQRLEQSVGGERAMVAAERVRQDLMEMAKIIAQLKIELASDDPEVNRFEQATEALDAVVRTTESATSSILEAAEQIQEIAWTLREAGADGAACDTLDQRAADIYTACSFQDLTAQRTKKVVLTMRSIEGRINGLVDAWSTGDAPRPAPVGDIPPESGLRHARHLYTPVQVGRQTLATDEIELVMREDPDALEAMDEYPEELPVLVPGPDRQVPSPQATQMLDEGDIFFVDTASDPAAIGESLPDEPAMAAPPPAEAKGPTLAEIDALPTVEKLRIFS